MLSFKENFFFFRFAVLFFILVIFGYWGLDLNSEELYIAFSFFALSITVFILVRNAVLLFFVKSVNLKYSRILVDLLIMVASLRLQLANLRFLSRFLVIFKESSTQLLNFLVVFVLEVAPIFKAIYSAKAIWLSTVLKSTLVVYARNYIKARRSSIFFGKFFDINL